MPGFLRHFYLLPGCIAMHSIPWTISFVATLLFNFLFVIEHLRKFPCFLVNTEER